MKINTALILCAGYGKRLNPLTLDEPKPLLKINEITLLENCINLIQFLGLKKVIINTFYLKKKIENFIKEKKFDLEIQIIDDGDKILNTGGGILNMINSSNESDFLTFNPDTIWNKNYVEVINNMEKFYFSKEIKNVLLLANKNLSFDKKLKGDFNLLENVIKKNLQNDLIKYRKQLRFFIGDIRDLPRLKKSFNQVNYVIHAAAIKQVPVAEYNPFEAVKTNIIGTQNVVDAALEMGIEKVISLSTDKASSPASLYGATKLTADKIIVAGNYHKGLARTKFSVVRYGNVFGPTGSEKKGDSNW